MAQGLGGVPGSGAQEDCDAHAREHGETCEEPLLCGTLVKLTEHYRVAAANRAAEPAVGETIAKAILPLARRRALLEGGGLGRTFRHRFRGCFLWSPRRIVVVVVVIISGQDAHQSARGRNAGQWRRFRLFHLKILNNDTSHAHTAISRA